MPFFFLESPFVLTIRKSPVCLADAVLHDVQFL